MSDPNYKLILDMRDDVLTKEQLYYYFLQDVPDFNAECKHRDFLFYDGNCWTWSNYVNCYPHLKKFLYGTLNKDRVQRLMQMVRDKDYSEIILEQEEKTIQPAPTATEIIAKNRLQFEVPTNPETEKQTMKTTTSYKITHTIEGSDVNNLTASDFLSYIAQKEAQIAKLKDVNSKSTAKSKVIATLDADLKLMVAKFDELHG